MKPRYGVLLLDHTELMVRIYERDANKWKLLHYEHVDIKKSDSTKVVEAIANIFISDVTEYVVDWKLAALNNSQKIIDDVSTATGFPMEKVGKAREQELLCKGLLLELYTL